MFNWRKRNLARRKLFFRDFNGGKLDFRDRGRIGVFDVFLDDLNGALKYAWNYALKDVWHSKLAEKKTGESFLFAWEYKNKIISNNFTS